jgi:hypothetical protein
MHAADAFLLVIKQQKENKGYGSTDDCGIQL